MSFDDLSFNRNNLVRLGEFDPAPRAFRRGNHDDQSCRQAARPQSQARFPLLSGHGRISS